MFTNAKRTVIIIVTSAFMNLLLFLTAYFFELPLWLDTTGTIYAALILGFPAGFIVAIINNVTQALFFYGLDSLRFYLVSALTALVTGFIMKKNSKNGFFKWVLLFVSLMLLSILLSTLLNFWAYGGIPADHWGNRLYYFFIDGGLQPWLATVLSVSSIKALDVLVSVVFVALAYRLTPTAIREEGTAVKQ